MLSKKMAFSLMSLITLLALTFVAPSAMAGEFDVGLDTTGDVSSADDLQLDHPGDGNIEVVVKFDQAVKFDAATAFITTYDKDGKLVSIAVATGAPAKTVASKEITLTIPVKAAAVKVNIKIAKGVASANPINADTSKALDVNIGLVSDDAEAGPTVYSIRRADNPLLPVTAATVQVIVTLSEKPKEFKKGNLSISDNATIADPAALDPVAEDPNRFRSVRLQDLQDLAGAASPVIRGLYNMTPPPTDDPDTEDIDESIGIHAALQADEDLIEAVEAYNRAVAVWNARNGDAPGLDATPIPTTDDGITDATLPVTATTTAITTYNSLLHDSFTTYRLNAAGDSIEKPGFPDAEDALTTHKAVNDAIEDADIYGSSRSEAPTAPAIEDNDSIALYRLLVADHNLYNAEKAARDAYEMAVEAEMEKDEGALTTHFADQHDITLASATGRDSMLHPYVVTITPKYPAGKGDIVLKIGAWEDTLVPIAGKYVPPQTDDEYTEGVDKLTIKVGKETLTALTSGTRLNLPHGEGAMIPASGFYLLTKNKDGSGINYSHEKDDENLAHKQTPAQLKFNVRAGGLPNLETFLANGGTIHLVAYDATAAASAYISEVMWGSDASQDDSSNSQWIEIANATSAAIAVGENKWALWFYQANATPPTSYIDTDGTTAGTIVDMIGTESATGFWSVAGKGQGGRTNVDPGGADVVAIAPTQPLISMSRVMDTVAGGPADGTMPTSWMASTPPSVNFKLGIEGTRIASPGADRIITPSETASDADALKAIADALAAAQKTIDSTGTIPKVGQIYISEIMFAGGGRLPQWIEISNGSRSEEINLSGWTITVYNAAADADVDVGATATFTIPDGTKIDPSGQSDTPSTILVVTEKGRNNLLGADASGQVINLAKDNEVELILAGVVTGKYTLLSEMAFMITLAPPEPRKDETAAAKATREAAEKAETVIAKATRTAAEKVAAKERKDATDMAGNLGADGAAAWVLPMSEDGRSSIIRGHVQVTRGPAAPEMGNMMDSWVLASETSFAQVTHIRAQSYYGAANDVGTPGFRAGGALPVELSHFSPARDKVTGAVVITWSTQSELNNAGFFIKRSQQRDGEFKVINATMIPGAGTTSEKQSYTYSDTTAQPNVVYYYQIEDVSLDGNRQTLTRGIRLKGHVECLPVKLTTLWGDLKTSQ